MRTKINIILHYMAVVLVVFFLSGCSDDDKEIYVFNKPCLQWGVSQETVKQQMNNFILLYNDNYTLIYKGQDSESLISYAFESDELYAANVFIREDMTTLSEIEQSFNGYSKELDGQTLSYVNKKKTTLGQISVETKSGKDYFCISWCNYDLP